MEAARQLVEGLGGAKNIVALEPCMMRIRATCKDPSQVDEAKIRQINPLGVVRSGPFVQIIVRFHADEMVQQMESLIKPQPDSLLDTATVAMEGDTRSRGSVAEEAIKA